jgi:nitrate/nitrite-specific signal transduction histidine kinase
MHERSKEIGVELKVDSQPGAGTKIIALFKNQ